MNTQNSHKIETSTPNLLHNAIKNLDVVQVELLLKNGANPNHEYQIQSCFSVLSKRKIINGNSEIHISGLTPLMLALNEENPTIEQRQIDLPIRTAIVALLLNFKADPNKAIKQNSLAPLHFAANYCQLDNVKQLLAYGAKTDCIAFPELKFNLPHIDSNNITPALLSVNSTMKKESSDCISLLINAGANLSINKNIHTDYNAIISSLSVNHPTEAENIFSSFLEDGNERVNYNTVMKKLYIFIKETPNSNSNADEFVQSLLGESVSYDTYKESAKYLGHLKSWNGLLTYKSNNNYEYVSAFSWEVPIQIPKKIKNLAIVLKKLETSTFDCLESFGEPKTQIITKLKNEIWNQTTNYLTSNHTQLLNRSFLNKAPKDANKKHSEEDNDNQTDSKVYALVPRMESWFEAEALRWSQKINALNPGQSFSIAAGGSNHAIYIEFAKQDNGCYSRYIYNLGIGKKMHPKSNDDKIYPHVVRDIPENHFSQTDSGSIKYLSNIIFAKSALWTDKIQALIYDATLLNGRVINSEKELEGVKAMKYQVTGNCSVKNNSAGLKNRLNNDKLYSFIKNFEIQRIKNIINVPCEIYNEKEKQHDLATIKFFTQRLQNSPQILEAKLFRFLQKRCSNAQANIPVQPGIRIAALLSQTDPKLLHYYSTMDNDFTDSLQKISTYYKIPELQNSVNTFIRMNADNITKICSLKNDMNGPVFKSLNSKSNDIPALESELFSLLSARASCELKNAETPGKRVSEAINKLGKEVMDFYVSNNPLMIKFIDLIAKFYKQNDLQKTADHYSSNHVITVNSSSSANYDKLTY